MSSLPRRSLIKAAAAAVVIAQSSWIVPRGAQAAGVPADPVRDLVASPDALAQGPSEYRPKFRWWWPTDDLDKSEIDAELHAIKDAGFAGVEQSLLRNGEKWGSTDFRDSLLYALGKATSLGLTFDITLGPGWPVSSPEVGDVAKELSAQDLHYGAVDVAAEAWYDGPVPDNPPPGAAPHKRLVAVTAARVLSRPGESPAVMDPATAVDLTDKTDGSNIRWRAPGEGAWRLFGFWMRPTGQINKISGGATGPLVVDHLNRAAIQAALDGFDQRVFDAASALLRVNGGDVFEDSYELAHGPVAAGQSAVFWTRDMISAFRSRRAYSPRRLLPGLFDEYTFPEGADERLKNDYTATVNELLVSEHLQPIARWAAQKGLTFRGQAFQSDGALPTNPAYLAKALPKPDVETLGFGDPAIRAYIPGGTGPLPPGTANSRAVLDRYRQVVSGAHLSGATEISNEWGAALFGDFRQDPKDLKALADHSFAAGVSRMVLHGFAYRNHQEAGKTTWLGWAPWIGQRLSFADSWNQDWPQLKALRGLADYTARAGAVLRTGRPRVDVTVLSAASSVDGMAPDPTGTAEDTFRKTMHDAGLTWDVIGPDNLTSAGPVRDGRLLPHGPAYKAVLVHDHAALSADAAEQLITLAAAGLPVVIQGAIPARGMGFRNPGREDTRVKAAMAELKAMDTVRFATQPGAAVEQLLGLGVRPDVAGPGVSAIVPVHRRTTRGDVWFLYNNSTTPYYGELTFLTTGAPTSLDLWTGEATPLGLYRTRGRTVTVPVRIGADDTAVLLFDRRDTQLRVAEATDAERIVRGGRGLVVRDDRGGKRWVRLSDGSERTVEIPRLPTARTVTGPWTLTADTVSPTGGARAEIALDDLRGWSDIPELKGRSGTGSYVTAINLPASWLGKDRGVELALGDFAGAVRVWVNGTAIRVAGVPNGTATDVTSALRTGLNEIRIEVSTNLGNALRSQALTGDPAYASWKGRPEFTYGLLGPVRLMPYGQAEIARRRSGGS
ncbi:glycosyl hydrolase [Streptomyces sp. NPDC097640]|uniref:glycosyl hydrolase n=1 Tax=Streptomyces sp. NPDC097640 TaxID=3157229 RepID=UPI00332DAF7F